MIKSFKDIAYAFDNGQHHTQRFYKGTLTNGDTFWQDWSFGAGQPAYDARIGTSLSFNPFVAVRNDAIWFPDIPSTMERRIVSFSIRTLASSTGQTSLDVLVYDLLGVYPLIDGDSTDEQILDNTLTLPRYADGRDVLPVIVNHVSPIVANAAFTASITDSEDNTRIISAAVHNSGQNKVCSGITSTLSSGCLGFTGTGVKTVNSIQFTTAPGGLFAIYMIKPLFTSANHDGSGVSVKIFTEKELLFKNAAHAPRVLDGAWLGMFLRPNGSARTISSVLGEMTFIWN